LPRVTNDRSDFRPSDSQSGTRAVRRAARRRRDLAEAVTWLMADARGRLAVWELLAEAGVFHTSMRSTPEYTAFAEGRREMGLRAFSLVTRLCPADYARMAAEQGGRLSEIPNPGESDDE
jgi:hypothetical protein